MNTQVNDIIPQLKADLKGRLVMPDDDDYLQVCEIWNAMVSRKPAMIVQCADVDDVCCAVKFAQENSLEIAIRGGGHNIAGNAVCDDGIVIDFSNMTKVHVDADKKRAYVEPGARLGDFDKAVQAHGLATPVGINSTTGIAGLTLGGGFGWLTRKYGMTIDNLVSVELVTLDGKKIRASNDENSDLFWATCGGGGNFGVVTQFEYKLHSVGPEIFAGLIVFPFAQAEQVLNQYRTFSETAPEELSVWVILRDAPPLPFLPEDIHGKRVIVLAVFYTGDAKEAQRLVEPLRGFGDRYGEHLGSQPYLDWQQAFDPLLAPGARNYWKSHNLAELSDGAISSICEYAAILPSEQCEIFIALVSGAANRVAEDSMAYSGRDAKFVMNVHARWDSTDQDDSCISWARGFFNSSKPSIV